MSEVVKTAMAEQVVERRAQRPLSEHDAYLKRETVAPEPPSTGKKMIPEAELDSFREAQHAAAQQELRDQEQARELKRMEWRREAAIGLVISAPGLTFRAALPPELAQGGLEGGAGLLVGRLLATLQARSFYRLEHVERVAMDPAGFEHGPITKKVAGGGETREPCPCRSKSCVFAADAAGWDDRVTDLVRQLAGAGLLIEET